MNTNSTTPLAVVLATCNGAAYLEQQLQSLLQQTRYPDLILIFDDASDDSTPQLLEKYASLPGIKITRNITRMGANENFKHAVAAVPAGYDIAFCDQDDYWLPEKLERSVELLHSLGTSSDQPALIYSDLLLMDEHDQIISESVHQQRGQHRYRHVWDTFIYGNMVSGCTIVMNSAMKQVMSQLPKTDEFIYDAWLAMAGFGFGKIACLPQPYIRYRQHSRNLTFSEHRANSRWKRWKLHLTHLFRQSDFLQEEIALAKAFHSAYSNRLSAEHLRALQQLIRLEDAPYWKKKITFEKSFRPHWKNRFS
jgi:glycosyltransferase involved in cell wall biosynthesis